MKNKNIELEQNEKIVFEENGYILTEQPDSLDDLMSTFVIYDERGNYIGEFSDLKLTDKDKSDFRNTLMYDTFLDIIDGFYYYDEDSWNEPKWHSSNRPYKALGYYSDYSYKKEKTPEEKEAEKKLVDDLCKSDTIVFHQEDPTTVMLNPIYEGKGWDVYKGGSWGGDLSTESIHELIKRHDRVVCLGHGTSRGLLSGIIGKEEVPLLKDKKIFSMWCYAATFWKENGFEGHGILTSDNFSSEVWECKSACDATVSKEWIFDNMMLAGEIAGKAIDMCWTDPVGACELFRKEYSENSAITTEDERKVVEFNTNSMQVV